MINRYTFDNSKINLISYFSNQNEFGQVITIFLKNNLIRFSINQINQTLLNIQNKYNLEQFSVKKNIINKVLNLNPKYKKYIDDEAFSNFFMTFDLNDNDAIIDLLFIIDNLYQNDLKFIDKHNLIHDNEMKLYQNLCQKHKELGIKLTKSTLGLVKKEIAHTPFIDIELIDYYKNSINNFINQYSEIKNKIIKKENPSLTKKVLPNDIINFAIELGFDSIDNISCIDLSALEEWLYSTNRYLRLANAMYLTRHDWNDGIDAISDAIDDFIPVDPIDEKILSEINECIELFEKKETDGRIFRDCDYSYDVLYDLINNEKLLKLNQMIIDFKINC